MTSIWRFRAPESRRNHHGKTLARFVRRMMIAREVQKSLPSGRASSVTRIFSEPAASRGLEQCGLCISVCPAFEAAHEIILRNSRFGL